MDLSALGRQFGLTPEQTQSAFEALAPVVAAGVRRNTQDDGGFADLIGALAGGNHSRYVEEPDVLTSPQVVDDGNAILGHVFGSKDVSRGVAQQLSASTGIGESILKKMLPIIAAMVMGQIAKKTLGGGSSSGGGGLGDILGQVLGGGSQGGSGGGLADILGQVLGGGQAQQRQAPSGGGGGLGDILGDLLGGAQGGRAAQPAPGGGGLQDILKDMLGGAAAPEQREQVARGRKTLDEILGGGSSRGSAADDLLASVERSLRRR